MKIFTNLPGSLRFLFSVLRVLTVLFALLWVLAILCGSWASRRLRDESHLTVSMGDILVLNHPAILELRADSAKPGALAVESFRGTLKLDLFSKDAELVSAIRRTVLPAMAVIVVFAWLLFTALRNVCANIERGDVFTEKNQRLVRDIGFILIAGSVAGAGVSLWGSFVMDGYLSHHVTLLGTQTGQPIMGAGGVMHFMMPAGLFSAQSGLVTGLLVLVISEAFRQGLALKTENDLTV
jgi:hypothetical protein